MRNSVLILLILSLLLIGCGYRLVGYDTTALHNKNITIGLKVVPLDQANVNNSSGNKFDRLAFNKELKRRIKAKHYTLVENVFNDKWWSISVNKISFGTEILEKYDSGFARTTDLFLKVTFSFRFEDGVHSDWVESKIEENTLLNFQDSNYETDISFYKKSLLKKAADLLLQKMELRYKKYR